MENKMEAIICSNVNKSYGKKEVLKNIDFTLEKGKIYGLIGRNGAGNRFYPHRIRRRREM